MLSSTMKMMMAKFQKFKMIRKLHTVISKETIKPSSPTPSHLKTHNLSIIDHLSPNVHMPFVFFYQNYNNSDTNILKKSLSQTLTQYYPFAGRLSTPFAPHIECNDEGVFVEASIHNRMDDFVHKKEQDETFDQLIPNALGCAANKTSPNMATVQLSHFACGGAAVAVSTSHKASDGFTMANFISHWATLTRGGSPINPTFFSSSMSNFNVPEFRVVETPKVKYATKRFVFPNSKLIKLKNKINAMGASPVNPSRVESLTSLLFKCAVSATITKSGSLQQSSLNQMVNLRGKTKTNFPELASGNLYAVAITNIRCSGQTELNEVITSLRKKRMELEGVRNMEDVGNKMVEARVTLILMNGKIQSYICSSLCRFPFYQVDFGWGKPVRVMLRNGMDTNFVVLMDTPCGDGIEASVQLKEEEMVIFQKDEELLSYAQEI